MARGVAIPEVREQLFAAADRVLTRTGPAGLTTRAITAEAGVANGVLHRHFRDLDSFWPSSSPAGSPPSPGPRRQCRPAPARAVSPSTSPTPS